MCMNQRLHVCLKMKQDTTVSSCHTWFSVTICANTIPTIYKTIESWELLKHVTFCFMFILQWKELCELLISNITVSTLMVYFVELVYFLLVFLFVFVQITCFIRLYYWLRENSGLSVRQLSTMTDLLPVFSCRIREIELCSYM